jgi:hypothetical protein
MPTTAAVPTAAKPNNKPGPWRPCAEAGDSGTVARAKPAMAPTRADGHLMMEPSDQAGAAAMKNATRMHCSDEINGTQLYRTIIGAFPTTSRTIWPMESVNRA